MYSLSTTKHEKYNYLLKKNLILNVMKIVILQQNRLTFIDFLHILFRKHSPKNSEDICVKNDL